MRARSDLFSWAAYAIWAPSAIECKSTYDLVFGVNDIKANGQLGGIGVAAAVRPAGPDDDPGYIYLIRSHYSFKIGKSRNLHGRTRLFGVKLPFPFPFEVELAGWCARYSETGRALHWKFGAKRLGGE